MENYESQSNPKKMKRKGRLLDMDDNWCLLSDDIILEKERGGSNTYNNGTQYKKLRSVPHPHKGHSVLYVPGHWGSFSQSRSMGAHGTRWTGPYGEGKSDQEIYESLLTGEGMHDGRHLGMMMDLHDDKNTTHQTSEKEFMEWWFSSSPSQLFQKQQYLDEFSMDVFALDFNGQGAALHASTLLRQAEFFARAVETIVQGCHIPTNSQDNVKENNGGGGITIVAHSIGAWVVRIALKMHPRLSSNGWIRNVVTLASPLGSVPYAVDSGVHDIARHINDNGHDEGDVTMISISGGLRDEMIPPEVCQVPPTSIRNGNNMNNQSTGFVSSAFLATSVTKSIGESPIAEDQFGMDHRAIVWCYDLLKVVRGVIFSLVVSTDKGLISSERMNVVNKIMHQESLVASDLDQMNNKSRIRSYQELVFDQHARLLQTKGYAKTVSVQLSAPYHLNSLLKLCIVSALLHTSFAVLSEKCVSLALSILTIPSLITVVTWVRQSRTWQACYEHECQLLVGTIYILSQLATLLYIFILHGVSTLVAAVWSKCSAKTKNARTQQKSFWGILVSIFIVQIRLLALVVLPLTAALCYTVHTCILGYEDNAWNRTTMASYCFISFLLFILLQLVTLSFKPSQVGSEQRRSELLVLLLALIKATLGKTLYAFSLSTRWGQSDMSSYDSFLSVMNSYIGTIAGHHNEMYMCVITQLLPVFAVITVIRTHDIMIVQNATIVLNKSKQANGNGDTVNGSNLNMEMLNSVKRRYNETKIITIARTSVVCWFSWTPSSNFPSDNLIVPLYSFIMAATTHLRCLLFTHEVMNVCSAIINDDLSLQCESPKTHDKNE